MIHTLSVRAPHQGLSEITGDVEEAVRSLWGDRYGRAATTRDESSGDDGLCTLFVRHTSASLTIQENADPSARRDLEAWLNRLVPENDPLYTHTSEGPDDMPAHVKAILTNTSLTIPVAAGKLALGTWQGIYLWEHRRRPRRREVVIHLAR